MKNLFKIVFFTLLLLTLFACDTSVYSNFKITYKSFNIRRFIEPGARTVVFPILAREYIASDPTLNSIKAEAFMELNKRDIPIIPFDEFYETLKDSGLHNSFINTINAYYKNGKVNKKALVEFAKVNTLYEPKFIMLMKVERAESYVDFNHEHKIRLFISGKLFYIKGKEIIMNFACASIAKGKRKTFLPELEKLVESSLQEITKGLPFNPATSVLLENEEKW